MERLQWFWVRLRVHWIRLRHRPHRALWQLQHLAERYPCDVDLRLKIAELEVTLGQIDSAIADAGIAIQLAPSDLRGMSLLLRAQATREAMTRRATPQRDSDKG